MRYLNGLVALALTAILLVGCGSPAGGGAGGGSGGGGTPPVVGASTLTITMPLTTLAARAAITVSATLLDGAGAPVSNECVTFSTNRTSDTLSTNRLIACQGLVAGIGSPGVAKTNALGVATTTLTTGIDGGAGILTVAAGAASSFINYTVNTGTVMLALTDIASGAAVSNIVIGSPIKVTATVLDGANVVVPNVIVTFTTNAALGAIIPASATALTDITGKASVNLDGVATGAATVTANVQLGVSVLTGSAVYSVGAAVLTMPNAMVFGVNPLSANGSTSVSVDVFSGGALVTTPVAVSFSSNCSLAGTATISSPVTTVNGTATATYTDKGCGAVDTITASLAGIARTGILTITPPGSGSIQFVSAVPAQITLKGTGGLGRQETSIVTFRVLDTGGNPLAGKIVNFTLSTTVGGITLSQPNATSDALGLAVATVSSGTISTPVRVIATTQGVLATPLQTLSDVLTITTGIPDQDSVSLSATKLNIEGWGIDGTKTILTMRLSDHFNNPVPDGTAVNFITEGGQIVASCTTGTPVAGACTSTLTSANPRPANGRVTVLAFAIGNESFTDLNSNGFADPGEMIDLNGFSTDLAEAFLNTNDLVNATHDAGEFFVDFNADGLFTAADGKYNGVLCNPAAGVFCAVNPNVHVRGSIVITFSSSAATITPPPAVLDLGGGNPAPVVASDCNTPATATFRITDINGNAMPVGTTISFATTNGTLTGTSSFVVPNTNANVATSPTAFDYTANLKSDATFAAAVTGPPAVAAFCTDATPSGALTVTVTSPLGVVSTGSVTVNN